MSTRQVLVLVTSSSSKLLLYASSVITDLNLHVRGLSWEVCSRSVGQDMPFFYGTKWSLS
jgi:hypothetical protein